MATSKVFTGVVVASLLVLVALSVIQIVRVNDLEREVDRLNNESIDYAVKDGEWQACVEDKLHDLEAGVTTTTVAGEEYPC